MSGFDFGVVLQAWPVLWSGMQTSLILLALAMGGGVVLGTGIAIARLNGPQPVAGLAAGYVNGLRSVPLMIGRPVGAFASALVAFTLFEAAYHSEIIRADIGGISRGQGAAAAAGGLSRAQAYRHVILPQAFRRMAPVLLTQSVALFQDTSLVYVIGLQDFMTAASVVANREGRLAELYLFAALAYFVICFAACRGVQALSKGTATR